MLISPETWQVVQQDVTSWDPATVYRCNQTHTVHNQAHSINHSFIWHLWRLALAFRCRKQTDFLFSFLFGNSRRCLNSDISLHVFEKHKGRKKKAALCWHVTWITATVHFLPGMNLFLLYSAPSADEAVMMSKRQSKRQYKEVQKALQKHRWKKTQKN